ncbi:zinc-binding dehydrogenase [Anaeromyxobacter dehalogenans]|uniref:zinc-binding dehydrogenase n=1 Tax=Anaeromyxobacter dehalogenans TaxID=161493 RepID=UPI0002DE03CE
MGSRETFEALNRLVALHRLRPAIARTYPFERANEAIAALRTGDVRRQARGRGRRGVDRRLRADRGGGRARTRAATHAPLGTYREPRPRPAPFP